MTNWTRGKISRFKNTRYPFRQRDLLSVVSEYLINNSQCAIPFDFPSVVSSDQCKINDHTLKAITYIKNRYFFGFHDRRSYILSWKTAFTLVLITHGFCSTRSVSTKLDQKMKSTTSAHVKRSIETTPMKQQDISPPNINKNKLHRVRPSFKFRAYPYSREVPKFARYLIYGDIGRIKSVLTAFEHIVKFLSATLLQHAYWPEELIKSADNTVDRFRQ